ncbi:MAG: RNA polymerase sigma factor [Muribaculaceae bacterium]|nr:RNA polymerase sigma factor [Muribaculaceae bacterium]MDE6344922.1 RNA polymerase sigma factor [Muribaculaceae bacterium]
MKRNAEHIVSLIKAGKSKGFRLAIDVYWAQIRAFALDVTGNDYDADEVTDDTFIRAFSSISQFDPQKSAFTTWLMRIAHNTAISHLRKRRTETVPLECVPPDAIVSLSSHDNTEDPRISFLKNAIARLDHEDRSIIHQFYYEEYSIEDIAYVIGKTPGATATRLHRIRQRLKSLIENHYD